MAAGRGLRSCCWPRHVLVLAVVLTALTGGATRSAQAQPRNVPPEVARLYQDYPVVELVTMGVGALIWERHGHIALCVRRANPSGSVCYNYGIGNFADPVGMGWGFFRGTNSFWAGEQTPRQMFSIYEGADRTIWVQPLPLSPEEKQRVLARLDHDVQEANKYYAYDHFWDNCTTRVRDVLDEATGGKLRALTAPADGLTYRDLARKGFYGMRLPLLITDLAMGRATDRVPTYYERMFLPDYMREAATRLWGIEPIVVYQRRGPPPQDDGPSGRVLLALVVLLLTAPAWISRWLGRFGRTGLWVALVPQLVLGLAFWVLALISPLPYVRWNETCLLLLPLDVMLAVGPPRWRLLYARGRVGMIGLVALLLLVDVLHQPLWPIVAWPLIPAAVVGFWPARWTRARA